MLIVSEDIDIAIQKATLKYLVKLRKVCLSLFERAWRLTVGGDDDIVDNSD